MRGRGGAVAGLILLRLVLAGAALAADPASEGQPAPDFTLPDLANRPVRLEHYRDRKAVLINFWATWCLPCREEMPTLERLRQQRRASLEVLGVNLDTVRPARVRAFVRELGLTFPILLDRELRVARLYRVRALPVSVIVDVGGVIRHREIGYRDWTDRDSGRLVDDALDRRR